MQTFVFYNFDGFFGIFQKKDNEICYLVENDSLISVDGIGNWDDYLQSPNSTSTEVTKESIEYFLSSKNINPVIKDLHKIEQPGHYYPRIYRNNINYDYVNSSFLKDMRAYQNIQSRLDELFNYIEPDSKNLMVFSHKIRELLILACTEVECLLVNLLRDNGYQTTNRYTTNDYVKCNKLLGLSSYSTQLTDYPELPIFKPFINWDVDNPTKSLSWYDAYNAIKHNRSENMPRANFEHLLNAIAAIHIVLESQYSKHIFQRWTQQIECKSIFSTQERHIWKCSEVTIAPILIPDYPVRTHWDKSIKIFK